MKYKVVWNKKVKKQISKCPKDIQESFNVLVQDIKEKGPIQKEWRNFSSLGENKYHCHLNYRWVACWTYEKEIITVEVYYVGSREKAPY